MALHGDNQVIVRGAIVWDGINRPETNDQGRLVHSLKIVLLDPQHRAEVDQLSTKELTEGLWRGNFPANGHWPVSDLQPGEFGGAFDGRGVGVMNVKTYNGVPEIWEGGRLVQAMIYGPKIYPGAIVDVLLSPYSYNQKSKGIAMGLNAIQLVDSTLPKLAIAGGGGGGAAAFGGGAGPQTTNHPPQGQQQQVQAQGQQGGYAPPPQGQQGGYAPPPQGQQGGYAPPPQGQQGGYAPPPPQGQQGGYAPPPQGQQQGGYAPDPQFTNPPQNQ